MDEQHKKIQRLLKLSTVFTPGTAVQSLEGFSGRWELISSAFSVISQPGQHVALFGDRGVGKTSLANILGESFAGRTDSPIRSVRYPCSSSDTFETLWRGLFKKLGVQLDEDWPASPASILEELQNQSFRPLLVVDELDRFDDHEGLSLLADTIKALSDEAIPATVVLVGVSDTVDQLIGDHESIGRALVQIKVDRMSRSDLGLIVRRGLAKMEMVANDDQIARIADLSEGLPHYTHLLAFYATERAIQDDRSALMPEDVSAAIQKAIDKAQDSIRNAYARAIFSPRHDNLFSEVLLACALAPKTEVGYFSPGSVREPLNAILNRDLPISAFTRHLNEFTKDSHGSILQKRGQARRWAYRFTDPMLQPYVLLKAIAQGALSELRITSLRPPESPSFPDSI